MAPHRMYNLVFNFFPKVLVFHDVIIVYVGIYVAFEEVTIQWSVVFKQATVRYSVLCSMGCIRQS